MKRKLGPPAGAAMSAEIKVFDRVADLARDRCDGGGDFVGSIKCRKSKQQSRLEP